MLLVFIFSCGPKPRQGVIPNTPYNVRVDAQNAKVVVWWEIDRAQSGPISGYNIYLSEKPLESLFPTWEKDRPKPYNHTPYPGDTDGDVTRESFEIINLENGKRYFLSVRTVGQGGIESDASGEVSFVPLSKGDFIISSKRTPSSGGFNFEKGVPVPVRDPRCDIYIYAKKDVVGMSSPSRLSAGLRKTRFLSPSGKKLETIKIRSGDKLTVITELGKAEIRIKKISRKGTDASVTIGYQFIPEKYAK